VSVSDAKTKKEKIDELEELVTKLCQKQTVELENVRRQHAEDLLTIQSAHAEEMAKLNVVHAEELETCRREMESKDGEISELRQQLEALENVISRGRVMVDELKSDIADKDECLKQAEYRNCQLEDEYRCLKNEQTASELAVREQQREQIQSMLDAEVSRAKAAEAKLADVLRALEQATETTQSYQRVIEEKRQLIEDQQKELDKYKLESDGFDVWADRIEKDYGDLLECFQDEQKKNEALEEQVKGLTETSSRLEAEKKKLASQKPSDNELHRQLAEVRLEANKRKTQLEKLQDEYDDKLKKMKQENARLTEEKRDLQNTIRRQENALNDTYADQRSRAPQPAAAASQVSAPRQLMTSCGVVEEWCITQYEAEVTRLQRELKKKDKENEYLNRKVMEFSNYTKQLKQRRGVLKTPQETTPVNSVEQAAATALPTAGLDVEPVDKLSDCKPQ